MLRSIPYFARLCPGFASIGMTLVLVSQSLAQYPRVSKDVRRAATAKTAAMQKRSDAAWRQALPTIKKWESRGKPYIPWAAKPDDLPQADIPAFPGAQGGGMYSHGGRGGRVFVVTNLKDRGPGSFREACEAGGPRIVVFNVAGIIKLDERLIVRAPYITIDGSRAPGDGVCIAGDTVELETHDVIVRHMRFRRGSTWVGDRNDSLGGNPVGNIMIDHVSASWGLDENLSMYRHMYQPPGGGKKLKLPTVNITIQNSIFSEALNTYNHAFGSTLGGYNATFHHNLWACNTGRNPSVGMIYDFTFANNVLFNWRHRTIDGGDHRSYYSIINNYFKPGPITDRTKPVSHRLLKPEARRSKEFNTDFGRAYVDGNIVEGNTRVSRNNWDGGVQVDEDEGYDPAIILPKLRSKKAYPHVYIDIEPAQKAFERVVRSAGATLPRRDAVDQRVIKMVQTGKGIVGTGIIRDISDVGGYPVYAGTPYPDCDGDGMANDWEIRFGLDPEDSSDASKKKSGKGYTNIECFLYRLDPGRQPTQDTPRKYRDLFGRQGKKFAKPKP